MRVLALLLLCACGRIGYDKQAAALDAPTGDGAPLDTSNPACPPNTTEISPGASVCIEKSQRGSETWVASSAACTQIGRRLCTGTEWVTACSTATLMMEKIDDWEWVAENNGVEADKWGNTACDAFATHTIDTDPYGYRCCVAKQ